MNAMHTAALALAGRGWPVFPMTPGGKRPAVRDWERRATTDPERIARCWSTGAYNVGIATGPAHLVVVDLDTAKPGETAPEAWNLPGVHCGLDVLAVLAEQASAPLPLDTFTVSTPSGGLHLYFAAPTGETFRNTAGDRGQGLGWHIDTRAGGGCVAGPGSEVDGRPYVVEHDAPVIPLPGWLVDRLRPKPLPTAPAAPITLHGRDRRSRYLDAAIAAEVARVESASGGERNQTLYIAACALGQLVAGGGLTEEDVRATLLQAASGHLAVHAYSAHTANSTITSGLRAGARRPRQVAA
ncbi:bifunctional DNA primase/polymerase [Actinokineospora auranticolor]|uniref:Bifunctional DNA primase/polymerase-like protein n=1 Tax=Actinokineospora auranticolor TaxID=155976 RepID=A0A2S6GKX3_9PSEU|nr:bifunctional DNA primase/polymerase [Actinokineospora auranticolor]PPK65833.1 bifunctional DNA primase/polymerase-like protein [Actinokineospora auranticolor]